jgi:hypothetical protein
MRARVISTVMIVPLLITSFFALLASGKQIDIAGAKLEGTIFVTDSEGKHSFVPGATVKLTGAVTCEAQTDENGRYALETSDPTKFRSSIAKRAALVQEVRKER